MARVGECGIILPRHRKGRVVSAALYVAERKRRGRVTDVSIPRSITVLLLRRAPYTGRGMLHALGIRRQRMNYIDKLEWVFITTIVLAIIVMLSFGTAVVVDKTYHHYQERHAQEQQTSRVWPPAIPSCDKKLFKRIEDGCEHEGD